MVVGGCAGPFHPADEHPDEVSEAVGASVTLPIEVMPDGGSFQGPASGSENDAFQETVTFTTSATISSGTLYIQGHGLGYRDGHSPKSGKASVSLNNGATWVRLTNNDPHVAVQIPEVYYDGIGGGYRTVRVKVDLQALSPPGGVLTAGTPYTLKFSFNGTDGTSSGYRIIDFDILNGSGQGAQSVLATTKQYDDPDPVTQRWPAPAGTTAADRRAGERLFRARHSLKDSNGNGIIAACSDCHAQDGRDLQYYGYSNRSIETRARFHGLTSAQGNQIAAYIRSLNVRSLGRPWNPPYQPGPGRDSTALVQGWAAGAGLTGVLESETAANGGMLTAIFPHGTTDPAVVANTISATNGYARLNLREVPISIQLPDWNSWLPEVHPVDLWGEADWHLATGTFSAEQPVYSTPFLQNAVAGDFNDDGKADFALAAGTAGVLLFLGNGDGTFSSSPTTILSNAVIQVVAADFNADGHDDLLAVRATQPPVVLLGNGDGTFAAPAALPTTAAQIACVLDFDHDGKLDVLLTRPPDQVVRILKGDGHGGFAAQPSFSVGGTPQTMATGDLDGDGFSDLAVMLRDPVNQVLLIKNHDGVYSTTTLNVPTYAYDVALLDIDQDGDTDVAVSSPNGISTFMASGGSYTPGSLISTTPTLALTVADVDLDGHADLLAAEYYNWRLFRSTPGLLSPGAQIPGNYPAGRLPVADFDGDWLPDVLLPNVASVNVGIVFGQTGLPNLSAPAEILSGIRHDLAGIAPGDARIPGLPKTLGRLDDVTSSYIGAGSTHGVDNQHNWRTTRGTVLDLAVLNRVPNADGYTMELVKRSLAQWMAVKYWELMQEFSLEQYGDVGGELYHWPLGHHQGVHPIAPHITSDNMDSFDDGTGYKPCDNACADDPPDPYTGVCQRVRTCYPVSAAQTGMKGDYDSSAWYHLQMILHPGSPPLTAPAPPDPVHDALHDPNPAWESVHPVDWPYSLEHVDDVDRRVLAVNPAGRWESLRFVATLMKAYQMRNNGQGPSYTGWELREISPRILVGNYRGRADRNELILRLGSPLRDNVIYGFLKTFNDVAAGFVTTWPRFSSPPTGNTTVSWYKVEDGAYVLAPQPDPVLDAQNDDQLHDDIPSCNPCQMFYTRNEIFHHANHIARTVDLLTTAYPTGFVRPEVDRLRTFGGQMWGTNNNSWTTLPACSVTGSTCSCFGVYPKTDCN
jgi:hypothetical protein